MNSAVKVIGLIAGVLAIGMILTRKREDGTSILDDLSETGRGWGNKLADLGTRIKDRLLHHVKGPNGEDVFADMYDRQYYVDADNKRVYLGEAV